MSEFYPRSLISFRDVVLNYAQGQLYLLPFFYPDEPRTVRPLASAHLAYMQIRSCLLAYCMAVRGHHH
jgi:hypothetical protein